MAAPKILVISIIIALAILGARADAGTEASDSPLNLEIEGLRSKLSSLDSSVLVKSRELDSKERSIAWLEQVIEEKSANIASLQSKIESIQKKGLVDDAQELVGKAHVRSTELEKQVEKLKSEIELQTRRRDALEARASEAENRLQDMNLKLGKLQQTIDEQKHRIRRTEHALKEAEEELMRAQLEATSKFEGLNEIHGAWLPPWLAIHIEYWQDLARNCWNIHIKPAVEVFAQKASEKSVQVKEWIQPHLEIARTKWMPAVKQQVMAFKTLSEPYVRKITAKTVEVYGASKSIITPNLVKAQESSVLYFQEAQKFAKPYIDQVATVSKPHVEKVRVSLKPYTKRALSLYKKLLKSVTKHHLQVQGIIREKLKKHEAAKPLATEEFAWLVASGLLALPLFFVYRLFSAIFCKKSRRRRRNTHGNHTHRKSKRRHAEK